MPEACVNLCGGVIVRQAASNYGSDSLGIAEPIRDILRFLLPRAQEKEMSQDRISGLLATYFTQPYVDYGEAVLEIRSNGGLTAEEVQHIKNQLLRIDANTIIRHAGTAKSERSAQDYSE